jgi:hypothetical protein
MAEGQNTAPEPDADEAAPAAPPAEAPLPADAEPAAQKWDGDFDPERAARLVSSLRKELTDAKGKLRAREEADMTEVQKLTARAETAERELAEARTANLRTTVAAKFGLPPDLAAFLTASDEATMTAQAETLAKNAVPAAPPDGFPGRPVPRMTPGYAVHPDTDNGFDPVAVAKAARRR